jgi:uncharacterized membrane protein
VLVALFVNGMWIRHYFNLKHQGTKKPSVLISGIAAFFAIMLAIAPWHTLNAEQTNVASVTDEQAWAIIDTHCTVCHATNPRSDMFTAAPAGFVVETLDQAKTAHTKMNQRAVITKDMPLGNLTAMTEQERQTLGNWLSQF